MPKKEYRQVCAECGNPIAGEQKWLRVLRFPEGEKHKWDKLIAKINSLYGGGFWAFMGPLLIMLVSVILIVPFPKNPLYPNSFNFIKGLADFFLENLIQDGTIRLLAFIILAGVLFDCVYIPLAIRRLRKLKKRKAEILAQYDFRESGENKEDYVVEEMQ